MEGFDDSLEVLYWAGSAAHTNWDPIERSHFEQSHASPEKANPTAPFLKNYMGGTATERSYAQSRLGTDSNITRPLYAYGGERPQLPNPVQTQCIEGYYGSSPEHYSYRRSISAQPGVYPTSEFAVSSSSCEVKSACYGIAEEVCDPPASQKLQGLGTYLPYLGKMEILPAYYNSSPANYSLRANAQVREVDTLPRPQIYMGRDEQNRSSLPVIGTDPRMSVAILIAGYDVSAGSQDETAYSLGA